MAGTWNDVLETIRKRLEELGEALGDVLVPQPEPVPIPVGEGRRRPRPDRRR